MDRLTESEVRHYREKGYLLYNKPVLSAKTFAELRRRFDEYYDEHRNDGVWDCMHWHDDWFLDLLCNKAVIDNLVIWWSR